MTIGNDDQIRAFLADEARRELAAAPSLEEAVGRLAPRVAGRPSGASQRLIVLLAATLLLVAALGTAIAVGSGILRLPLVVDSEEPSGTSGSSRRSRVRSSTARTPASGPSTRAHRLPPRRRCASRERPTLTANVHHSPSCSAGRATVGSCWSSGKIRPTTGACVAPTTSTSSARMGPRPS